jgi:hypothetical protein
MNRSSKLITAAVLASSPVFMATPVMAQIVYDFETNIPTGATGVEGVLHPTGPDGFFPNSASESNVTQATVGVEHGTYSMEIVSTASQTYGGAITSNVKPAMYNGGTLTYYLTGDATAFGTTTSGSYYINVEATFFSTDGEIDPNTSLPSSYSNLANSLYSTTPETLSLAVYKDPLAAIDGDTAGDYTINQILGFDQTEDPTDAITSFQFTLLHSSDEPLTAYVDALTVTPVPEPASLGILASLGVMLGWRRR